MKPCSRKASHSSYLFQNIGFGLNNTVSGIKGSTKKLGEKYRNALVVLFNKANLQPIAVKKPDINGEYQFLGLNDSVNCFVIGFDSQQQYNAAIQDNVVPK